MILQYDGTAYKGWQVQKTGTTIQGLLQDVISRLTGERVQVIGAGRTDAGVHALAQVASFDTSSRIEPPALQRGLNALLPADIRITGLDEVTSEFHPRHSAYGKRYIYLIASVVHREEIPVFLERYVWRIGFPLDTAGMNAAANWIIQDLTGLLNKRGLDPVASPVTAQHLADLITLVADQTISGAGAKQALEDALETGDPMGAIVERRGLQQVSDASELGAIVDQVIADNDDVAEQFRAGKASVIGFLVGQVMKASGGSANPKLAQELLRERLSG